MRPSDKTSLYAGLGVAFRGGAAQPEIGAGPTVGGRLFYVEQGAPFPGVYTMTMYRIVVCLVLACAGLSAAEPEPLTKYFVAFLYKGPKFAASSADSPERKRNHEEHVAYIDRMQAAGKMILFGPIADAGD